jgi:hypothetical protein
MGTKSRLRFSFWLDITRDTEFSVAEQIQYLKHQRSFTKTVRDGIRLVCDLRAGRLNVLLELFPWVKAELLQPVPSVHDSKASELQCQLERLEKLLIEQRRLPTDGHHLPRPVPTSGPRALNVPKFDLPRLEDNEDGETLVIQRDTSTDSALNFLNSMMALQQ